MTKAKILHGLLLSLLIMMFGCVSGISFPKTKTTVDSWQLKGKIGISYPDHRCDRDRCPPKSEQGKIDWKQDKNQYSIRLFDPFGRELIRIHGDENNLQASSPGKKTITTTPDQFITLLNGQSSQGSALTTLSQDNLRHWVTGREIPGIATVYQKQDKDQFIQKNFIVTAKQWRNTAAGILPSLITITNGKNKMRLVVREWLPLNKNK